jgi:hypothetical protein
MEWLHAKSQKGILGTIPLIVLTALTAATNDNLDVPASQLEDERLRTQKSLTELSSNSVQIIVPSGHQMHLEVPDVVAAAIQRVVVAVKAHQSL